MKLLDNLTKEDLIKVIATMHDTIQEWNNGWGMNEKDGETLITIGAACCAHCRKLDKWELPEIKNQQP